jgi:hypothetical protein
MDDNDITDLLIVVVFDTLMIAYIVLFGWALYPEILQPGALRKYTVFLIPPAFCGIYTVFVLTRILTGWKPDSHQWRLVTRLCGVLILAFIIIFFDSVFYSGGIDILNPATLTGNLPEILLFVIPSLVFIYPACYQIVKPLTDDQVRDLQVLELDLHLPYDRAISACDNALKWLDENHNVTDCKRFDQDTGTLSMMANPIPPFPGWNMASEITIYLEKTTPATTRVTISSITPTPGYTKLMFKIPSGLNERYVNQIRKFLETNSESNTGIPRQGT